MTAGVGEVVGAFVVTGAPVMTGIGVGAGTGASVAAPASVPGRRTVSQAFGYGYHSHSNPTAEDSRGYPTIRVS